jgi:LPXTG-motif cell wall-anchored protein
VIAGTRTVRAAVPGGDAQSTLTIAALAVSVLLLGGVLGSIARRRRT